MRRVVIWRSSSQPNAAAINGVRVKTAEVDTGAAVFSPSNIRTKYTANMPPSTT